MRCITLFFIIFPLFVWAVDVDMVRVKGGKFVMGCFLSEQNCPSTSLPAHEVTVKDFYIGRYEVTNALFCTFLNEVSHVKVFRMEDGRHVGMDEKNSAILVYDYAEGVNYNTKTQRWETNIYYALYPAVFITWFGAVSFCEWVGGRLPTEEEWEYAARGGPAANDQHFVFSGSNHAPKVAWYNENSSNRPHQVGMKDPNRLGLYDMSGNVYEWCQDSYKEYEDKVNPPLLKRANFFNRVIRGGCWKSTREEITVYHRLNSPFIAYNYIGFRVCKDIR